MGNQPSGEGSGPGSQSHGGGGNVFANHRGKNPFGDVGKSFAQAMEDKLRTGALGLSKSELDRRCQPSGLYNGCFWDDRTIRRLIGDGKLAARLKGSDERKSTTDQECPICFLYYSQINVSKCCNATICTECYLQVRPQQKAKKHDHTVTACASGCPFCNNAKLYVSIAKPLEEAQVKAREIEEQKILEASIKARSTSSDLNSTADTAASDDSVESKVFGSSLDRHSKFLMRARSESNASSLGASDAPSTPNNGSALAQMAMTPAERRALESEMKAQLSHPLALRLEAEAAERQLEHDRAYRATAPPRSSRRRRGRDWNRIIDEFERGGNGQVQSIDDIVVLEAAILLSAEQEARRGGGARGEQSEAAAPAPASAPAPAAATSNSNSNASAGPERPSFDITRHAREGFPLVQSFLASRFGSDDSDDGNDGAERNRSDDPVERALNSPLMRNLAESINRGRNRLLQRDAAASLMMRGMSEEQQLEMAIAASLRDQAAANQNEQGEENAAETGEDAQEDDDEYAQEDGADTEDNDIQETDQNTNATDGNGEDGADMPAVMEEPSEIDIDAMLGLDDDDNDTDDVTEEPAQSRNSDSEVDRLLREAEELVEGVDLSESPAQEAAPTAAPPSE